MTISTILRFLFGNAEAIRKIAESKSVLAVGMILVLLTAIARNYDQTFILEKPLLWVFGPLLFSIGSATFIFCLIYLIFIRHHLPQPRPNIGSQYLSFLGLFWMTAPIAWLYAIPVERFLGSYEAAQANLALLATVALWRVLLLARVISVIQITPFGRALLWVLLPACVEVFGLYIFGGAFAKSVMSGMGGMRNSPEETLLLTALYRSAGIAFWIGLACLILLPILQNQSPLQAFPERYKSRLPWIFVGLASLFWISVSIYPQQQVKRNAHLDQLVAEEKYKEALQFLSLHQPHDFAPARTFPPKPYEVEIFEKLPKMLEAMDGSEPKWVRELYLSYLAILINHKVYWKHKISYQEIVSSLNQIPEGASWLSEHGPQLSIFTIDNAVSDDANQTNSIPETITTNTPPE
ncbi:MAG: hypothetical protein H0X66_09620 [Verrucomicrobia bacterium]|nr:hypothetical protein [Verrucomicrobiota bacterium]